MTLHHSLHHWGINAPPKNTKHHSPPSHLLKVTKFLVEISLFKFLGMTKKNIFVYKLFLLNISDFSLFFM